MCFFNKKKKELLNPECVEFCKELDIAIGAANSYFSNPCIYIDESTADLWLEKYAYIIIILWMMLYTCVRHFEFQ